MSSHISHVRKRIQSIREIQQTAEATETISITKHSKLQKLIDISKKISEQSLNIVQTIGLADEQKQKTKDIIVILMSPSRGLCGGFKNKIKKQWLSFAQEIDKKRSLKIIKIGNMANKIFNMEPIEDLEHKTILDVRSPDINNLLDLAKQISELVTPMKDHSITFLGYSFYNLFRHNPEKKLILPIEHKTKEQKDWIIDEDKEYLRELSLKLYLINKLYHCMVENTISENASRFVAMDSAALNADNLLEHLKNTLNKMRQTRITREITELTASLKDNF